MAMAAERNVVRKRSEEPGSFMGLGMKRFVNRRPEEVWNFPANLSLPVILGCFWEERHPRKWVSKLLALERCNRDERGDFSGTCAPSTLPPSSPEFSSPLFSCQRDLC